MGPVTPAGVPAVGTGQPQLPCTGISEDPAHSPQQPGLHLVLEGHGGKWGAGVNLRCQRFYT